MLATISLELLTITPPAVTDKTLVLFGVPATNNAGISETTMILPRIETTVTLDDSNKRSPLASALSINDSEPLECIISAIIMPDISPNL